MDECLRWYQVAWWGLQGQASNAISPREGQNIKFLNEKKLFAGWVMPMEA